MWLNPFNLDIQRCNNIVISVLLNDYSYNWAFWVDNDICLSQLDIYHDNMYIDNPKDWFVRFLECW